ncbi:hypothetical protein ACINWC323_1353 [Acinetobacter sp. WC-323]|uniref:hypothetical protein n=1 Tax=Acinetobacter sp. WC-323 TaxID=903918 RepID=UPI00029E3FF5|nr:hypothetical protein [Acinetobacter sp. WC-323]EKU55912.1 hypothetical protein ACINWC323_1353 [Acinetobacter sp. WC-323]
MNLLEALVQIEKYSEEETIYSAKPWILNSETIIMIEPDEGGLEFTVDGRVYSYFLEIFLVKELLSDLAAENGLSLEGKVLRIIQYAYNDA